MRASVIMALAVVLFVIHRWAVNKPAVTLPVVLSGLFAIGVIALLDTGRTEEIAKGFAWLFFAGAAYNAVPDLAKASNTYAASKTGQAAKPPSH
jgi:hypothetical protein